MIVRVVALAISYVLGIVLATTYATPVPNSVLVSLAAIGTVLTLALAHSERKWREWPRLLLAVSAILCGLPLGYWRTMVQTGPAQKGNLRHELHQLQDNSPIQFRGQIGREPDLRDNTNVDLHIRVTEIALQPDEWESVKPGTLLVRVYITWRAPPEDRDAFNHIVDPRAFGYTVQGSAKYRPAWPVKHPGEFDFAEFLHQNDALARFRVSLRNIAVVEETRGNVLVESALWAKRRFIGTYKSTVRGPASRLVSAATLGTRRSVDEIEYRGLNVTQTFRHAGVGHVLAVSGLHVSVISLLLYSLFRMAGMRPRVFTPILIGFLILFALLTGARPSSVRAVVMNSVILIAFSYFRYNLRSAAYIGLAISAMIILLINPVVLYAPSFLLSYGAVMSLVLISPVLDRWICLLRGFALLFFFAWFCLVLALSAMSLEIFFSPANCLGLLGLLWAAIVVSGRLNERFPTFWHIGLERVPRIVRLMISAQIAIQVGMMIPFSAWFFGQFPVAGVLVNLFAIPAIGVLVQLGMIAGLLGLIPGIGIYLATPFGAADSLVGEFFFRLAHTGATLFPFPATPKPSLSWMIAYYIVLAGVLSIEKWRIPVQGWFYRHTTAGRGKRISHTVIYGTIALLLLAPLTRLYPHERRCETITCYAASRVPVISMTSHNGKAILLNAGDSMDGERLLFSVIRGQGAASIETAILTSPRNDAGNEGLAALCDKMDVATCFMPFVTADPNDYLTTIGDPYLLGDSNRTQAWVQRYVSAYGDLSTALAKRGANVQVLHAGMIAQWDNLRVNALPSPVLRTNQIAVRNLIPVISFDVQGFRWLVITECDPEVLAATIPRGQSSYDVVVLPELSSRSTYQKLVDTAVACAQPRVVVIAGDRESRTFDAQAWAKKQNSFTLFTTPRDGAILATLPADNQLHLQGFLSGRSLTLPRR